MIDVNVLRGSFVRHTDGREGQVLRVSLPWVRLEWVGEDGSETMLRSDPKLREDIEVLTTDRGWIPLGSILGVVKEEAEMENYDSVRSLVEEVRGILDLDQEDGVLSETKKLMGKFKKGTKHNPFKRVKKGKGLGPGPRGSTAVPGKKRNYWKCRCQSYKCLCRGSENEKKIVKIGRSYKSSYNIAYRKWRKKKAKEYEPGGKRGFKKVKKGKLTK